jgi:hypothetical protein
MAKPPAVPAAVALRKLERLVRKTPADRQPELRAAVRRIISLPDPGAAAHNPVLGNVLHSLRLAERALAGPDPEAALVYLSFGLEKLTHLVEHVLTEFESAKAAGRSA